MDHKCIQTCYPFWYLFLCFWGAKIDQKSIKNRPGDLLVPPLATDLETGCVLGVLGAPFPLPGASQNRYNIDPKIDGKSIEFLEGAFRPCTDLLGAPRSDSMLKERARGWLWLRFGCHMVPKSSSKGPLGGLKRMHFSDIGDFQFFI